MILILLNLLVLLVILALIYIIGQKILAAISAPPLWQQIWYIALLVILLIALLGLLGAVPDLHWRIIR